MSSDRERLLSDILAERGEAGQAGELREELLNRTLHHVTRRRRIRQVRRAGSVLLLLLSGIVLLVWRVQLSQRPAPDKQQFAYSLVRTAPLPPSAVIETRPFTPSAMIASAPSVSVASITTRPEERGY